MIIKKACQYCGKTTDITSEIDLGSSGKLLVFACGHSYIEEPLDKNVIVNATVDATVDSSNGSTSDETIVVEDTRTFFQKLIDAVPEHCEVHGRMCIKAYESKSGKHLFPYQRDGIIAAYKNNAKFIFADEMGLGKTIQALVTIYLNKAELLPAIFVCKSIAKTNMLWEVMDILETPAQIMESSSETPWDMFKIHIISYDLMNRLDKMFKFSNMKPQVYCPECNFRVDAGKYSVCPECKKTKRATGDTKQESFLAQDGKRITDFSTRVVEEVGKVVELKPWFDKSIGVGSSLKDQNKVAWTKIIQRCKTLILDEVHLLKNPESQRSKALKVVSTLIPHRLLMSGTLMKNNAVEYFVPLNIVRPEKYWRYNGFCQNHVRYEPVRSVTGKIVNKYTGLKYPGEFLQNNKDIMIRRTTDEVMPELPKLWKQPKYIELDEAFKKIYEKGEESFVEWFENASDLEIRQNILGQLALLRHQTSLAKIDYTIDLAMEHIMQTGRKVAIFTHHIDSREFLADKMIEFFRGMKKSEDDSENAESIFGGEVVRVLTQDTKEVQKDIETFKNSETEKILILSTLAHGESINLQFMSDCILHERQWNPANEDQAISGRFRRIGQESKSIIAQIPTAIGTIDEYLVELNERKGVNSHEIDTGVIGDYNTDFVRELAERIVSKGRAKWKL